MLRTTCSACRHGHHYECQGGQKPPAGVMGGWERLRPHVHARRGPCPRSPQVARGRCSFYEGAVVNDAQSFTEYVAELIRTAPSDELVLLAVERERMLLRQETDASSPKDGPQEDR
jgi:hypothetical protein